MNLFFMNEPIFCCNLLDLNLHHSVPYLTKALNVKTKGLDWESNASGIGYTFFYVFYKKSSKCLSSESFCSKIFLKSFSVTYSGRTLKKINVKYYIKTVKTKENKTEENVLWLKIAFFLLCNICYIQ